MDIYHLAIFVHLERRVARFLTKWMGWKGAPQCTAMSNPEENLPPPPADPLPSYTPPPPSGPPPGYMPPPPSGPPPGYQAPPPGYGAAPGYQQPPPGYGAAPGYQPPPGYAPPTGNMQAQLQTFIRNAQNVITKPSVAAFDAIQSYADWSTVLIALGIASGIYGVLSAISSAYLSANFFGFGSTAANYGYNPVGAFIGGIFAVFVGFFIATGVWWLIAKIFQGNGPFLNYAHAIALILVPLYIARAVLGLIPFLGGLAGLAASIYALYLVVLATASTHRLPMNRAIWVVLIPIIAGVVIVGFFVLIIVALVAATLHH